MLPTLARRLALTAIRAQLPQAVKATKLKKVWPPDFTQLSAQEQLRFEKRYKRRMRLATQRPLWDKSVRLLQLFSVTGTWRQGCPKIFRTGDDEEAKTGGKKLS